MQTSRRPALPTGSDTRAEPMRKMGSAPIRAGSHGAFPLGSLKVRAEKGFPARDRLGFATASISPDAAIVRFFGIGSCPSAVEIGLSGACPRGLPLLGRLKLVLRARGGGVVRGEGEAPPLIVRHAFLREGEGAGGDRAKGMPQGRGFPEVAAEARVPGGVFRLGCRSLV